MPRLRGRETRLLASILKAERRQGAAVFAVLLVALALRLMMPALLGRFVDAAINHQPIHTLTTIAITYVVIALIAEALQLGVTWGAVRLSRQAGNRLRERLSAHSLKLEMAWHAKHSPGQLIERIDGDVEALIVFFTNALVQVLGNVILYGDLEERLGGLEDLRANGAGNYAVHRLHTNSARSWRAARRASFLG